jgi:hypothetical protein
VEIKGDDERVNTSMIYLVYCKKICKCHSVFPTQHKNNNEKKDSLSNLTPLGMVVHTYNPSTWECEPGTLPVQSKPRPHISPHFKQPSTKKRNSIFGFLLTVNKGLYQEKSPFISALKVRL